MGNVYKFPSAMYVATGSALEIQRHGFTTTHVLNTSTAITQLAIVCDTKTLHVDQNPY